MNVPDAVAPRDPFPREGQGRLQDPEHLLPSPVTGYAVLKTQRTGSIPRPAAAPPDSNRTRRVTGDCDASGGQPHQADISTPLGKLQTVTGVAHALALASSPPDNGIQKVKLAIHPRKAQDPAADPSQR